MTRRNSLAAAALIALVAISIMSRPLAALINPGFTPVELCGQANTILVATLSPAGGTDEWKAAVTGNLKGDSAKELSLALADCKKEDLESVRRLLASCGEEPIIVFAGGEADARSAYLSVAGHWLAAVSKDGVAWSVKSLAPNLSGTWAGGTDMLIPLAHAILADASIRVPSTIGIAWTQAPANLGTVSGSIGRMQAGPLLGDGRMYLFVPSTGGDRLYRAKVDDESFDDITAAVKLDTRSRCAAWMDVDADGRSDLVSCDGRRVTVRRLSPEGTLAAAGPQQTVDLGAECLSVDICSAPGGKGPALLAGTTTLPLLLSSDTNGRWTAKPLPGGDAVGDSGDVVGGCVVADLDNDGFCDVLQIRTRHSLLWKGSPDGFAAPAASNVACDEGPVSHAVGDFNQDGVLDVFVSGLRKSWLWENDGHAAFRDVMARAGSLGYKPPYGLSFAAAVDINHDGLTDLCLLHPKNEFLCHFNRGFRCFGEEGELRLRPPDDHTDSGQQSCAAADFNGDGAVDLAVAFANGAVVCHYNDAFNKPMIRVRLSRPDVGPITVSVWQGEKLPVCVGAATIAGRGLPVCFTLRDAGPCTVRWSEPGKPNCAKKVGPADAKPTGVPEVVLQP